MLDVWESSNSDSKAIKIGWWLAVILVVLLIYRRLMIDLPFIIIGFVVCIIYLFAFAADNGAEIDPTPIRIILAWIILISIIYVVTSSVACGSLITLFIGMISLIVIILCLDNISEYKPGWILLSLAIILVFVNLIVNGYHSIMEFVIGFLMVIIAIAFASYGYVKESLLTILIAGLLIGSLPVYSCS